MFIKHKFWEVNQFHQILLRINYLIIFFFIELLIQPTDLLAEGAWQLFQEDPELTIYNRTTEEDIDCEFKAVSIIHQPIEVVSAVLMDISTYMKWIHGCRSVKLLNKNNVSDYEVYFAIDIPWPFCNRDVVYKITKDATAWENRIIIQGMAIEKADVPIRDGHVRVINSYFSITLEKITNGSTKIIYQNKTDASFNLPAYLSRRLCGSMVYDSMANLKKLLNKGY